MPEKIEFYVISVNGTFVSGCAKDADGNIESIEFKETGDKNISHMFDDFEVLGVVLYLMTIHEIPKDHITITNISDIVNFESQLKDLQKM